MLPRARQEAIVFREPPDRSGPVLSASLHTAVSLRDQWQRDRHNVFAQVFNLLGTTTAPRRVSVVFCRPRR